MNYKLKLKDSTECRDGKFKDSPLFFCKSMAEGGFWEFDPAQAMGFESHDAAFNVAVREHARNPFHDNDLLFVIRPDGSEETISRSALDVEGDKMRRILIAEREERQANAEQAERLAEIQQKSLALLTGTKTLVEATTVTIREEVESLTMGCSPDTMSA